MSIVVYFFCSMIPLVAIVTNFFGKKKKFTFGKIMTDCISIMTALMLAFYNYVSIREFNTPATKVIWASIGICGIVACLQLDVFKEKIFRILGNLLGCAGIVLILFVIMMIFNFTRAEYWASEFDNAKTQEEKNAFFPANEFHDSFGFSLPDYDIIEFDGRTFGPDYSLEMMVVTTEPIDTLFLIDQMKLNNANFDEIKFENNKFYGFKVPYDCSLTLITNDTLIVTYSTH